MDEIELQALLLRNKIADIIQDEFTREMNYQAMKLIYKQNNSVCSNTIEVSILLLCYCKITSLGSLTPKVIQDRENERTSAFQRRLLQSINL